MTITLKTYDEYTREDVQNVFLPNTKFVPQTGTWGLQGIVKVPNSIKDYIFFVTYGVTAGEHKFDEGITTNIF